MFHLKLGEIRINSGIALSGPSEVTQDEANVDSEDVGNTCGHLERRQMGRMSDVQVRWADANSSKL